MTVYELLDRLDSRLRREIEAGLTAPAGSRRRCMHAYAREMLTAIMAEALMLLPYPEAEFWLQQRKALVGVGRR